MGEPTLIDLMNESKLFPWFRGSSWDAWRIFLKVLLSLELTEPERDARNMNRRNFKKCLRKTGPREIRFHDLAIHSPVSSLGTAKVWHT